VLSTKEPTMRLETLLPVLASAALFAAGCGSDARDSAAAGDAVGESSTVEFVAYDMGYEPTGATVPAGIVEITLVNEGAATHNVIVEEAGDREVVEASPGEAETGTIELEPGAYTLYCDIPGHRSAGMDRTLTVE
jgi:plastocyanin